MKRIIILACLALTAASCIIDDGKGNNYRTSANLLNHSDKLLQERLIATTKHLNYLLVLNEYLGLTEQEQSSAGWAEFKDNISSREGNILTIHSQGIVVDTKGTDLATPGNFWTISNLSSASNYGGYVWAGENSDTYALKITCTASDKYEFTDLRGGEEIMKISMEAIPSSVGGYDFSGNGKGKTKVTRNGFHSSYEVSDFYYKRHRTAEDGTGNSAVSISYTIESVSFDVHIYQSEEELDWCKIIKEPNGAMLYDCSIAPGREY